MSELRIPLANAGQQWPSTIPVSNVGGMDMGSQDQPERIDQEMPLSAVQLFGPVVASGPPFSVVFTDWLSMIPALGSRWRPACARTWSRKAS